MLKLSKIQTDVLARKLSSEISNVISDENKVIKKENVNKFLKTDVGKAVTKVNSAFFGLEPISNHAIENLALKYFNVILKACPSSNSIYNDIVLAGMESTDLNALIETIKAKYNVQENDAA